MFEIYKLLNFTLSSVVFMIRIFLLLISAEPVSLFINKRIFKYSAHKQRIPLSIRFFSFEC